MNETDKLVAEQSKTLPPSLQWAIKVVPWKTLVQEIGRANTLDAEQMALLEQETMLIIYGFENPDDYIGNLVREVGTSETSAIAIANAVAEKVLKVIDDKTKNETAEEKTREPVINGGRSGERGTESVRGIWKTSTVEARDMLAENQLKKLPEALQQAIRTVPWKSAVKEVALSNKLDLAQIVAIERETMFVIYGFEDEKNYLSNIMREASLDETVATAITKVLNEKIFKVITEKTNKNQMPQKTVPGVPEIPPVNLPMVEKGEVAHDVPHIESTTGSEKIAPEKQIATQAQPKKESVTLPDYRYPGGKDPYREPLV